MKHIADEAEDASDVDRYARDVDFAAASKLFEVFKFNLVSLHIQAYYRLTF